MDRPSSMESRYHPGPVSDRHGPAMAVPDDFAPAPGNVWNFIRAWFCEFASPVAPTRPYKKRCWLKL